jgi:hypothetical protein
MKTNRFVWTCVLVVGCGGGTETTDAGPDAGADVFTKPDTGGPDTSTDAPAEADPCANAPTTTFYVDAAKGNDANNGAAPSCAFKTISAALTASATHFNATLNVAAGTYGAGETFPIIVDKGRSLVGAGATTTTIQGASSTYNTTNTASFLDTGTHFVTLLAGDVIGGTNSLGATTISGFAILPPSNVTTPTSGFVGVACIAGNAPDTGSTPPLPTASLVLKGLTVGPNFDTGVAIGSSPTPKTGCNAMITASTLKGSNVGLATGVCGTANPSGSWPSAQVGDGTTPNANTFTTGTIDVFGNGCGSAQSYNNNQFTSGYRGIVLVSQSAQYFEILGNTFDGFSSTFAMGIGVHTNASAVISKLNGNSFTNISESSAADTAAGTTTGFALLVANVFQAHANKIHDNDNGIFIGAAPSNSFDFSSDGSSANTNEIYCNSKSTVTTGKGFDLILAYSNAAAANFAGNTWDNATPTTGTALTAANGTDVISFTASEATLTSSVATSKTCATNRTH